MTVIHSNYGTFASRESTDIVCEEKTQTKQSMAAECDINTIMSRYLKTGAITHLNLKDPIYGDHDGTTFTDAMLQITSAQEEFNKQPSSIRKRCNNNPAEFLDLVTNPDNEAELRELGILPEIIPDEPLVPVQAATPPATPQEPSTPPS